MFKEEDLLKIFNNGVGYAKKRQNLLLNYEEPEDFGSYCVEKKLKNKNKKMIYKFLFIDYLRKDSGKKGSSTYTEREKAKKTISIDKIPEPEVESIEKNHKDINKYFTSKNKRLDKIMKMYFIYGFTLKQIGIKFNCSESNIWFILNKVKDKIRFVETLKMNEETKTWIIKKLI